MALRLFNKKVDASLGKKVRPKTKTRAVKMADYFKSSCHHAQLPELSICDPDGASRERTSSHKLVSTHNTACVHSSACIYLSTDATPNLGVNKTTQLVTAVTIKPAGLSSIPGPTCSRRPTSESCPLTRTRHTHTLSLSL